MLRYLELEQLLVAKLVSHISSSIILPQWKSSELEPVLGALSLDTPQTVQPLGLRQSRHLLTFEQSTASSRFLLYLRACPLGIVLRQ